jgi:hypothetical protein
VASGTRPALIAGLLALLVWAPPAGAVVTERSAAALSDFDQTNAVGGALGVVPGGFGDESSMLATYDGGGANGYSRGIFNVGWVPGDEVWYSAAYLLPEGFKASVQGQVALLRWDDWDAHPEAADQGGVVIYGSDHRSRLVNDWLGDDTQIELSRAFDLPEGRWFQLEVHQRLGADDGLNEVYLDGERIARSDAPNLEPGRGVTRVRYGIVAIASGSQIKPLALKFDRARVGVTRTSQPLRPRRARMVKALPRRFGVRRFVP